MQHTITLKVSADAVVADPNPLPKVHAGDTVTFELTGDTAGAMFEIEFQEVRRSCEPRGPLAAEAKGRASSLSSTVAADQPGLFLYQVFRTGVRTLPLPRPGRKRLKWLRGMEGGGNFGGLEVAPPPTPKG